MPETKPVTILAEFPSLIATDIGVARFMYSKFNEVKYMKQYRYNSISVLKNRMIWRNNVNPLSILVKEEYQEDIDDLYIDIFNKYKEGIYANSIPTDILRFIDTVFDIASISKFDVACNNEIESAIIKKLAPSANPILYKDITNLSSYMAFYIYSYETLYNRKDIENIALYIPAYKFNLNDDFTLRADFFLLNNSVIPRLIDVYMDTTIPAIVSGSALDEMIYLDNVNTEGGFNQHEQSGNKHCEQNSTTGSSE